MEEKPSPASTPPQVEGSRRRVGSHKRKSSGPLNSAAAAKRLARERASLPPLHNGPCTRARQSPNKGAAAAAGGHANPPGRSPLGAPTRNSSVAEPIQMSEEFPKPPETPAFDSEFEAVKSRDPSAHAVPLHAGWYSWTKVHSIEERAMPSFFNGKLEQRSQHMYIEIRNAIMKKFHSEPHTNIELKTLSELSVENLDAWQEVMEFLDYWGLINFHPFPPTEFTESKGDVDETSKSSSLVQKLYKFEVVHAPQSDPTVPSLTTSVPLQLLPDSFIFEDLAKPEGVEYHCNSCSADCSRKRYHCQKQADFDLCTECYGEGKFGSDMTSADFILMEPAEGPGASGGSWTDQETLLLLEALELFGENWNEIAEHVATKTKTQCMLHFIQMPIEDPFLDDKDDIDLELQGKIKSDAAQKASSTPDTTAVEEAVPGADEGQSVPSLTDVSKAKDASDETPEGVVEEKAKDAAEEKVIDAAIEKVKDAAGEMPTGEDMQTDVIDTTEVMGNSRGEDMPTGEVPTEVMGNLHDDRVNLALDALKAAFEAGGSFSQPDEGSYSYSFADASNPVMTLVAFLGGLVKLDNAAAAAHSSLKALSEDLPSIQLAARHCFILEDPPYVEKVHNACESSVSDAVDQVNNKVDRTDDPRSSADRSNEKEVTAKDSLPALREQSEKDGCIEKESIENPVSESSEPSQVQTKSNSSNGDTPNDVTEESGDVALPTENTTDVDVQNMNTVPHKQEKEGIVADESDLIQHREEQCSESPLSIKGDMHSVSAEEKEKQLSDAPNKAVEVEEATASETDNGATITKDGMSVCSMDSKDEQNGMFDKLKRAALTTLSAAAVKAKLLADQQEDQILELVSLLIEKQLLKLETKLSLYMDLDAVMMRAKEQIDRARQRLYNERAQIIASRLGLPTSSSRPVPSSLLPGRTTMNYSNMGMRLQINTAMRGLAPAVTGSPCQGTSTAGSVYPA